MNTVINPKIKRLSSWKPQNKLAMLLAVLACVLMAQAAFRLGAFALEKADVPHPGFELMVGENLCSPDTFNFYQR